MRGSDEGGRGQPEENYSSPKVKYKKASMGELEE